MASVCQYWLHTQLPKVVSVFQDHQRRLEPNHPPFTTSSTVPESKTLAMRLASLATSIGFEIIDLQLNVYGRRKRAINDDNDGDNHQRKKLKGKSFFALENNALITSYFKESHSVTAAQSRGIPVIQEDPNNRGNDTNSKQRRSLTSTPCAVQEDPSNLDHNRNTSIRKLSKLESLPIEIILRIFLYSLNVNFPRASPYVAAAVSNEQVYRLLILLAYWDNDAQYDGGYNPTEDRAFGGNPARYEDLGTYPWRGNPLYSTPRILRPLGHDYVPLTTDERKTLQRSILQCKWCTLDRLRRQLPDLTRLIISRWCLNAGYMFEKDDWGRKMEEMISSGEGKYLTGVTRRIKKEPEQENREGKGKKDDYPLCRVDGLTGTFVQLGFGYRGSDGPIVMTKSSLCFPILDVQDIPDFLFHAETDAESKGRVRGCFTDTHLQFLETLRYSGDLMPSYAVEGASYLTYPRDAILQGFHTAIASNNFRALDILLKFDDYFHANRPSYTIPSDLYRNAARMYIDAKNKRYKTNDLKKDAAKKEFSENAFLCFCLLLTSCAESVPHDDPLIAHFAVTAGGSFGMWMLDFLTGFPKHMERFKRSHLGEAMFIKREPNDEFELGARFLDVMDEERRCFIPVSMMQNDLCRPSQIV